jgi:hypothetical protein
MNCFAGEIALFNRRARDRTEVRRGVQEEAGIFEGYGGRFCAI